MNQCLIGQPAGIGDVIFLQPIISHFSRDYQVIHPVLPQLLFLKDRLKTKAEIISVEDESLKGCALFSEINRPAKIGDDIYIPFEKASQTYPGCVIRAKYQMVGMDVAGWQEHFDFHRDPKKEKELEDLLELPEEFNLVNRQFGTYPGTFQKWEVQPGNDLPMIQMKYIEGFDVFDWAAVLEKASNIYTVDTCILMILEKLTLRAEKLEMWARWNNYESIDGLFRKPWLRN